MIGLFLVLLLPSIVVAVGRTRIPTPAGESWDSWFDGDGVRPDFMSARDHPREQERERF